LYHYLSCSFSFFPPSIHSDRITLQYLLVDRCMEVARFSGIDTPERKQAFGTQAKQALSSKVFSKTIRVQDNGKDRLVPQRDERPAVRLVDGYAAPEVG
jgi:hypothetical protein